MISLETNPSTPDHEPDDRLETMRHFFDLIAFTHSDTLTMTPEELHRTYVQAHDEVHLSEEEDHADHS